MIFDVHQMMLDDLDYVEAITHMIENQGINAEYAVATTGDNFSNMFAAMDDDYMKARAADVKDISNRVVKILQGKKDSVLDGDEPVILLADDLAPSETVQLDKSKVLAFVTRHGSTNSHTAILARTMNIPALIGVKFEENVDGKFAIVDGYNGNVYVEPTDDVVKEYESKKQEAEEKKTLAAGTEGQGKYHTRWKEKSSCTRTSVVLRMWHLPCRMMQEGIGLFRSEFLYLESNTFPTEEEQFQAYKTVAENMAGKKVIIRTLDIGADKQVDYFNLDKEDNPAMGYRAIRICLTQPEIFKTQLRALLRAAVYGNLSIMYPMITSTEEVKKIYEIVAEVEEELKAQEIQYKIPEQGIMIETPAAAIISDKLAEMVDFFSIGTNDLTQYTLAIDRQNEKLDEFYNPHHEAILRMIQMVVDNAHKCGKWAGICGELGARCNSYRAVCTYGTG